MSLAKSISTFYDKHKKQLALLVLIFFGYKIIMYFFPFSLKDPFSSSSSGSQCSTHNKCSDCVKSVDGNSSSPCYWSNSKNNCSAFNDQGFYRTCNQPPTPGPSPTKCETNYNCQSCIESDCFWGDRDQKCSSNFKTGYGKICSGSNPNNPNCPKCEACPKLTLVKTPTFITAQ
jgi:hypothetical protein